MELRNKPVIADFSRKQLRFTDEHLHDRFEYSGSTLSQFSQWLATAEVVFSPKKTNLSCLKIRFFLFFRNVDVTK